MKDNDLIRCRFKKCKSSKHCKRATLPCETKVHTIFKGAEGITGSKDCSMFIPVTETE